MTDCLKTARSALEQQLITENDYDQVKAAFLRAQQIRAGLDAGFIRQDDYDQIKQTFLQSLQGTSASSGAYSQPADQQPDASRLDNHTAASAPPQSGNTSGQTNRMPSFSAGAPPSTSAPTAAAAAPSATGTAHIPANIPKMGGSRPKQPSGVNAIRTKPAALLWQTHPDTCCCRHP